MGGAAVDRFYRVAFTDERAFRQWTERVVEFTALVRDLLIDRSELRPVIFVPSRPAPDSPLHAYVSEGARGLAVRISAGATLDRKPISAAELPKGLTMVYGDPIDIAEYEKRHE
jgi:hypothetical protein